MATTNSQSNQIPSVLIEEIRRMIPCAAVFHEAMGKKGNMDPAIKPLSRDSGIVGPARTVRSEAGDNLMLHKALLEAQRGEIIVADCQGDSQHGHWGEFMTRVAIAKGVEGLVIDAGVRDSRAIRNLGFGVFARGVSMAGTSKKIKGTLNEPVICGGIEVRPGELVVGDDDGVVVIPSNLVAQVLSIAKEKMDKEYNELSQILEGRLNYKEFLVSKGWLLANG